ncbi:formyltetrahydrofolate deformylase [Algimonas ampicilliniresistens]|uniref:Formyltetrahydrofolate deformylase n=1 Tax=Algimonas ampicilliniresistens TaxID=1298735 RepID=A0ABQ5VBC0_9PROT|nr:formyltetrahydrofolate deformylase [Algimonas ampicilliniresistens]GLQ24735.1 formyltetrahydrofolate deformylase [Algimonas ampicilliniresistens]
MTSYVLTFSCLDRPGIVAKVTSLIAQHSGNITSAQQFNDPATGRFFMRVVFDMANVETFSASLSSIAQELSFDWRMRDVAKRKRVLILVSKFDHCLLDLLYRVRIGELRMDVVSVVSNHSRESLKLSNLHGATFHHLPITRSTKLDQELQLRNLIEETGADFVILARYMQILSDSMAQWLEGRCINIHHSFLPGFKGARPYHQAHERGVKMIGATAHFVTGDLDEGPIIAQNVEPITHRDTPAMLIAKGRAIEQRVLASAVGALIEDRVFLNGRRTVVFD